MSRMRPVFLETSGEFCCEAAVLVAVFGLLDRVVKYEDLTWRWTVAALGCAVVLLVVGMMFEVLARA
jgi:hypothetical protein